MATQHEARAPENGPERVEDFVLRDLSGEPVRLSELFGPHQELVVIHAVDTASSSCATWVDGLDGVRPHLESRAAFVVESPDAPSEIGGGFRRVLSRGSGFREALGFGEEGEPFAGISAFRKLDDGRVAMVGDSSADDVVWAGLLELLHREEAVTV